MNPNWESYTLPPFPIGEPIPLRKGAKPISGKQVSSPTKYPLSLPVYSEPEPPADNSEETEDYYDYSGYSECGWDEIIELFSKNHSVVRLEMVFPIPFTFTNQD